MTALLFFIAVQAATPAATLPVTQVDVIKPAKLTLQIGTRIPLRLLDELSTKRTPRGQTFRLEVAEDIVVSGQLVIPAGTIAVGEVTRSDAKGAFGKSGKLEARVLYLEMSGRTVRMSGMLGAAGQGGTTETVLTAVAAGLFAFAITGKSAVIPVGTPLAASLDRSIQLPPVDQSMAAPSEHSQVE